VLLNSIIAILIILLYSAADPRGKAALVEKSKKNAAERPATTENGRLLGEGVF
jgi:hypothetical protein